MDAPRRARALEKWRALLHEVKQRRGVDDVDALTEEDVKEVLGEFDTWVMKQGWSEAWVID